MVSLRPAYSAAFKREVLVQVPPGLAVDVFSPDWAWGGSTGRGVKVAILDSGVDATHPDVGPIQGYVRIYEDEQRKLVFDAEPHEDSFGHGTACAGIIRRAAPDCEVYSVRVLGERLSGRAAAFVAGLRWAVDNGMQVANLSLSSGRASHFATFHRVADEAYFAGTVLVCAVNNIPVPSYPSEFAAVLSVAARAGDDPFDYDYNPDPPVEFGAPGVDVDVAWTGGRTIRATGNSFACPHVTGLVARLLSKHPGLTPFQVKTVLHALASNALPAGAASGAAAAAAAGAATGAAAATDTAGHRAPSAG
jgi:subtilisin